MSDALTIIVVEQDRARALQIIDALKQAGDHRVQVLGDGAGLARRVAEIRPDLVLIDIHNPSRDTLEELALASGPTERPVAVFVDRSDSGLTKAAIEAGKYFAPRLVRRLQMLCPEIEVVMKIGNREFIIAELVRHGVDLAVMGRPPRNPPVSAEPLGLHPHGLVAAPDHPLITGRRVTANDLIAETILAREEGSGTRILMMRYLDRLSEGRVFDFMEMDSNETIKQAAIAGLGIAFLSLHTVTDELASGRLALIRAEGLPVERHWFLVRPLSEAERPATARIHRTMLELNGAFLPPAHPGQDPDAAPAPV